jgi:hypothetical protein
MLEEFGCRRSENPNEAARRTVGADECLAVDVVVTFQAIVKRVSVSPGSDRFGIPGDISKSCVCSFQTSDNRSDR